MIDLDAMEQEWWFPVLTEEKWLARIRKDYPEDASRSDEVLREDYADGGKYQTLWDHTGEAYAQWEKIADAHLALIAAHREALGLLKEARHHLPPKGNRDWLGDLPQRIDTFLSQHKEAVK